MNNNLKQKNKGYTLIEMLFYIVLFAMLSAVVINSMVVMMKSFKEITIQSEIAEGSMIMERISREIKQSYQINSGDTPNSLRLDSKDSGGTYKLVEINFTNSNARYLENNNFIGNLNTPDIKVVDLTFTKIYTTKGEAIKIFLSISSNKDTMNRNYDFYDTVVLRGKY